MKKLKILKDEEVEESKDKEVVEKDVEKTRRSKRQRC